MLCSVVMAVFTSSVDIMLRCVRVAEMHNVDVTRLGCCCCVVCTTAVASISARGVNNAVFFSLAPCPRYLFLASNRSYNSRLLRLARLIRQQSTPLWCMWVVEAFMDTNFLAAAAVGAASRQRWSAVLF